VRGSVFGRVAGAAWLLIVAPVGVAVTPGDAAPAGGAGGQVCDTSVYPLSTPTTRFHDNGDGTVTDTQLKLMWMTCSIGQTADAKACRGAPSALSWSAAEAAAHSLNQGGRFFYNDWRLPQLPELASIAERQCKNPRINLAVFPHTPAEGFWSASSRKAGDAQAFVLSFGDEGVKYANKDEPHDVRLVRTAE
jgi:hypothetical protein